MPNNCCKQIIVKIHNGTLSTKPVIYFSFAIPKLPFAKIDKTTNTHEFSLRKVVILPPPTHPRSQIPRGVLWKRHCITFVPPPPLLQFLQLSTTTLFILYRWEREPVKNFQSPFLPPSPPALLMTQHLNGVTGRSQCFLSFFSLSNPFPTPTP